MDGASEEKKERARIKSMVISLLVGEDMYSEARVALYIYLVVYMNQGHITSDTILKKDCESSNEF